MGAITHATLTLTATTYLLKTDGPASGDVVVNENEIDFFNGDICRLKLPGGIGRYRWSITDGTLHLSSITTDPCGRSNVLDGQDYKKP